MVIHERIGQAANSPRHCDEMLIIGASFAPTQTATKKSEVTDRVERSMPKWSSHESDKPRHHVCVERARVGSSTDNCTNVFNQCRGENLIGIQMQLPLPAQGQVV